MATFNNYKHGILVYSGSATGDAGIAIEANWRTIGDFLDHTLLFAEDNVYMEGANLVMNTGTGSGGGNINMDGGAIFFPDINGSYTGGNRITTGTFDAGGLSLFCLAGYELNWQSGSMTIDGAEGTLGINFKQQWGTINLNNGQIIMTDFVPGNYASGSVVFNSTPADSDQFSVDGVPLIGFSAGTANQIGGTNTGSTESYSDAATAALALANLMNAEPTTSSYVWSPSGNTVTVTASYTGDGYNLSLGTTSVVIDVTGLSGGANDIPQAALEADGEGNLGIFAGGVYMDMFSFFSTDNSGNYNLEANTMTFDCEVHLNGNNIDMQNGSIGNLAGIQIPASDSPSWPQPQNLTIMVNGDEDTLVFLYTKFNGDPMIATLPLTGP